MKVLFGHICDTVTLRWTLRKWSWAVPVGVSADSGWMDSMPSSRKSCRAIHVVLQDCNGYGEGDIEVYLSHQDVKSCCWAVPVGALEDSGWLERMPSSRMACSTASSSAACWASVNPCLPSPSSSICSVRRRSQHAKKCCQKAWKVLPADDPFLSSSPSSACSRRRMLCGLQCCLILRSLLGFRQPPFALFPFFSLPHKHNNTACFRQLTNVRPTTSDRKTSNRPD